MIQRMAATLMVTALLLAPTGSARADDKGAAASDGENRFNVGLDHLRAGRLDLALEAFEERGQGRTRRTPTSTRGSASPICAFGATTTPSTRFARPWT